MADKQKILFIEWCAKDCLDGTQQMDPLTELAYRRLMDMIYATNDELLDDDKVLQYSTKTGAKWKPIKRALIDVHKKIYIEDGKIRNVVCTKKLEKSRANIAQKVAAGIASAEARKSIENNKITPTADDTDVSTQEVTGEPTNQKPNNHSVVVGNADASRETKSEILRIGNMIAEITGWSNDPRWFGDFARIEVWLKSDWEPEQDILPTVRRLMANRKDAPRSLKYFEQAIADAFAQRTAPLPKGVGNGTNQTGNHVGGVRSNSGAQGSNTRPQSQTERAFEQGEQIKRERLAQAAAQRQPAKPEPAHGLDDPVLRGPEQIRGDSGQSQGTGAYVPDIAGGIPDRPDHPGVPPIPQNQSRPADSSRHHRSDESGNATSLGRLLQKVIPETAAG